LQQAQTVRQKLNISTQYVVTMAARVIIEKGYQTFINAAKLILSERNDVTFLCVGSGNMLDFFKQQLYESEQVKIKFIGNSDRVEDIINISDICVLSSCYYEGVSNFILEAMAAGKPVIATEVGGTPEIVEDNVTGYLIEKNDVFQLKYYINYLLDNEDLRMQMGTDSLKLVKKKFSLDRMCDEFLKEFDNCLKQH